MTTILFVRHGESDANAFIHNDPHDPDLGTCSAQTRRFGS